MKTTLLLFLVILCSCNPNVEERTNKNTSEEEPKIIGLEIEDFERLENEGTEVLNIDSTMLLSLPNWFTNTDVMNQLKQNHGCELDLRLTPTYLEADFNGDGNKDLVIPIIQSETGKLGFVVIHKTTNEIYLLGAGTNIKNGLSDDLDYVDIWGINRVKINNPGLEEFTGTGKKGELIIDNPSLEIEKSEIGGGLLYWDGKEYAYFHQTC